MNPTRYAVVDYYDLRPLDWATGKRVPLEPGAGHVCDRCGAEHAVVYVVEDLTTGTRYSVGSSCAKASFGFDPKDEAKALVRSKKREADCLVNERRLVEVDKLARQVASEVSRLPRPPVVNLGDAPFKYAHFPRQLVRTFRMGEVEATELESQGMVGWSDDKTIALLENRWLGREVESRIPDEWKSITVAESPRRPRSTTTMHEACRSLAWRLL